MLTAAMLTRSEQRSVRCFGGRQVGYIQLPHLTVPAVRGGGDYVH